MTYCVAIKIDSGLIFASDSLTNAGIDHVSNYSKMHTFVQPGERMFVLLAAGNLATTQAVVKRLRDDMRAAIKSGQDLATAVKASDFADWHASVIDILNDFEQPLITSTEDGKLIINNLLIKDYPIIIHLSK